MLKLKSIMYKKIRNSMSKSDSNKINPETDSPKKVEKKGFFSRVARDVKNLGVGIASLPAHFATNPVDMGAKTALIAAMLCARYFSPPLRQKRSPLHTNFFAALCHPPF
jgi:hypothetical protein